MSNPYANGANIPLDMQHAQLFPQQAQDKTLTQSVTKTSIAYQDLPAFSPSGTFDATSLISMTPLAGALGPNYRLLGGYLGDTDPIVGPLSAIFLSGFLDTLIHYPVFIPSSGTFGSMNSSMVNIETMAAPMGPNPTTGPLMMQSSGTNIKMTSPNPITPVVPGTHEFTYPILPPVCFNSSERDDVPNTSLG